MEHLTIAVCKGGKEVERLDVALVRRGLTPSRTQGRALIEAGQVQVNGVTVRKPGARVRKADTITLRSRPRYVGRGGQKMEAALRRFALSVAGRTVLDVGASTGGFTDCLLQHGAARVYAVDVGRRQLAPSLRADPRVQAMEQTDIRTLSALPEKVDLIVVDVSFISLRLILPHLPRFLKPDALGVVALVKPQFEAGPGRTNRRGVLTDERLRRQVVAGLLEWATRHGWRVLGECPSPIPGGAGNVEFLVHLQPLGDCFPPPEEV
ncbi:MAG: TlyA family RNA methyltransferase [Caldilineae bacterium]|nr:MAG: TlyA family RNA methyltransferase [Caldilineae bacterium]